MPCILYILNSDTNLYHCPLFMNYNIIFDLLYQPGSWEEFQKLPLGLFGTAILVGKTKNNVRVTSMAKYIHLNDTMSNWGNDYLVGLCIQ